MSIFPQTFSDDKPIYYPSTWDTGKTTPELYEQWKQTIEYLILSNLLQCVLAGLWMWFISVLLSGIHEIWKLYKLEDNDRNKLANYKFIRRKFVMSVGFICFVVFLITGMLLVYDKMTRYALVKGYFTFVGVKWAFKIYHKLKQLYQKWKKNSTSQYLDSDDDQVSNNSKNDDSA